MKKILLLFLAMFIFVGCAPSQGTDTGSADATEEKVESIIESPTIYLETLKLDVNYTTYLPEGFSKDEETELPILYLLHGAFGNNTNYVKLLPIKEMMDKKIADGTLEPMILVFPDGFNSFYINGPGLDMEDAIAKDFIPQIEKTLNNTPNRDNRFIGGLSMGAYGAANYSLKYPDLFSKAILMSPAVWETVEEGYATQDWHVFRDENKEWDHEMWATFHPTSNFSLYKERNLPVEFFVITGEADEVVPVQSVKDFVSKLEEVADVEAQYDEEGIHGWVYWEKALNDSLDKFISNSQEK